MRQAQSTLLQRLGKAIHAHHNGITHAPLPRRWVDLIRHLDEQERKHSQAQQPEPQRTPPKKDAGTKRA
jgi:hypothetical protein